ncbi:MAG TPA: tetratricopeptide repeat protein [Bryobacteraceae bacterium]|nr:tetratricopeptide repeat protein [Bryobacteraceae bacterium]
MVVLAAILLSAFQTNFAQDGLKALDEKRYEAAAENFSKAVASDPSDFTAHFNLAFAYSMINRDADAITEYKKTLELKPGIYQAELNLGVILLRRKQAAEAAPHLSAAAEQKPKDFRPNYYLAEALRSEGQFDKAEPAYQKALEIDPKSAAAEAGLGQTLANEGKLDDAAPHFKKAADMDPQYREALLELAGLYEKAKRSADAIAIYQQFPDNPGAQEHVGELLFESGRFEDAVARFQAAVKASPTTANRVALAQAYIKSKQPEKAMPLMQQVVAAEPNNYELRMLYGRMIRDQRKFPEAAQEFYTAAQMKPDSAEAWSELAGVLVLAENYPAAIGALDKIAALHAEKPGHVYLRAITLDKIKQLKPALESYRRFLAMDGGKSPDEEFKARQRVRIIENELNRR